MDYKEKYEQALEIARWFIEHPLQEDSANIVEYIFTELAESKEERTRKEILNVFKQLDEGTTICGRKYDYAKWIAWLEKQGKKKPANKVEPKFKVSDWIIATGEVVYQIKDIQANVTLVEPNGDESIFDISVLDNAKLWTIHNAKDGDVLVDEDNNIGLYLEEKDEEKDDLYWHSCIYLGCDGYIHGFKTGGYHYYKNTKPATKEQRDLLFQKMKEAGYEWDGEKKELKKIELKKLDADNVWLQNYISNVTRLVDQLKKDFGL